MADDDGRGGPSPSHRFAAGPSIAATGSSPGRSKESPQSPEGRETEDSNIIPFEPKRAAKAHRPRHDGFTPAKQRIFFKVLKKSGCITDACRACGISRNTVRRWRDRWAEFDEKVEAALAIASVELDMIAWKRATEGAEEKVYRDGRLVFTRVKPSDSMLRLLMQGANPEKYGRTGQTPKRALVKKLRKEAEEKVRAEYRAKGSKEALIATLEPLLEGMRRRLERTKLAEGYTPGPEGLLIPPGWRAVRDLPALPPPDAEPGTE
jgi:hypothetical protein